MSSTKNFAGLAVLFRLHHLGSGGGQAEGEVAHHADLGVGAFAQLDGDGQGGGIDAHGAAAEVDALLDVLADVILGEFRLQNGLVNVGGQLGHGHVGSFFCRFHSTFMRGGNLPQNGRGRASPFIGSSIPQRNYKVN